MQQFDTEEIKGFIYRLHEVVRKAKNTGWGYYDAILDMLTETYEEVIADKTH